MNQSPIRSHLYLVAPWMKEYFHYSTPWLCSLPSHQVLSFLTFQKQKETGDWRSLYGKEKGYSEICPRRLHLQIESTHHIKGALRKFTNRSLQWNEPLDKWPAESCGTQSSGAPEATRHWLSPSLAFLCLPKKLGSIQENRLGVHTYVILGNPTPWPFKKEGVQKPLLQVSSSCSWAEAFCLYRYGSYRSKCRPSFCFILPAHVLTQLI